MTFIGVIAGGMILSMMTLLCWHWLGASERVFRQSELRTQAILSASVLLDEIKEAGDLAEGVFTHPQPDGSLVLVSKVKRQGPDFHHIKVTAYSGDGQELLTFETLVLQAGRNHD